MGNNKFWYVHPSKLYAKINVEKVLNVSDNSGFKLYENMLVHIVENKIYAIEENYYFDFLKSLIKESTTKLELIAKDRFERDILNQGKKLIRRLRQVDKSKILKDERKKAYKLFLNGYLIISESQIVFLDYSTLNNKLIWDSRISKREFHLPENNECLYTEFVENSIGISDFTKLMIGYLAHDFNEEGKGYLLVLTDQVEDKKDGGGTGKNLFCVLLRETINVLEVSAEQIRYDSSLLQSWNGERIFNISDAGKKFNWEFFKNIITGNTQQKKLYQDEITVDYTDMPKFLVSTNLSVPTNDGGLNRRIRVLEFSPFYKINGGVDVYHNGYFPEIWSQSDWLGFDNFIAECIQLYFKNNCQIEQVEMSDSGELKRFKLNYGEDIFDFIEAHYEDWVKSRVISTPDFNRLMSKYIRTNRTMDQFSNTKLNKAIEEYIEIKNRAISSEFKIKFIKDKKIGNVRHRVFEKYPTTDNAIL